MTSFREFRESGGAERPLVLAPSTLPRGSEAFQGDRAGLVTRLFAAGIDVGLIFVVVMGTAAVLWMVSFIVNPNSSSMPAFGSGERIPEIFILVMYGYFLNWLYWTVCWATSGRTVGNLVMGLRVINRKGKCLSWHIAALRSLFCTTFPVGILWVLVSGANRSVQDVVLRTSVIYDWVVGVPTLNEVLRMGRRRG